MVWSFIMKRINEWKPIIIENSIIPKMLSYISPINIGAITIGFVVFSKDEMSERTKRHEIIHFQQFLETLFIGFLLIYIWDYTFNQLRFKSNEVAYRRIRAEIEAYENDYDENYLKNRKRWKWIMLSPYSGSNLQ